MQRERRSSARFSPRALRFALVGAGLTLFGCWASSPSYIAVDLLPAGNHVGRFWHETTDSVATMPDVRGALYIRRQHRWGLPNGFVTRQETLAWFASQLRERGWVPPDPNYGQSPPPVPELQFLKEGEDYFTYYRPGDFSGFGGHKQGVNAMATVAVWRNPADTGTHVLLVTTRASFLRSLAEALD